MFMLWSSSYSDTRDWTWRPTDTMTPKRVASTSLAPWTTSTWVIETTNLFVIFFYYLMVLTEGLLCSNSKLVYVTFCGVWNILDKFFSAIRLFVLSRTIKQKLNIFKRLICYFVFAENSQGKHYCSPRMRTQSHWCGPKGKSSNIYSDVHGQPCLQCILIENGTSFYKIKICIVYNIYMYIGFFPRKLHQI